MRTEMSVSNRNGIRYDARKNFRATSESHTVSTGINLEIVVSALMRALCIPVRLKGFVYLKEAILLSVANRATVSFHAKVLQPIALRHNTTPLHIDSRIRYALKYASTQCNIEAVMRSHGITAFFMRRLPKNSEFVALVAEQLRIR